MKAIKHIYIGISVLMAVAALAACGKKKENDNIIVKKPTIVAKKPIQRVGDYSQTTPIEWGSANYSITVERKADAQLDIVDDGAGNRYYDNLITVHIVRQDGSDFFNRTFTKHDFASYVDETYRSGALLGIVFDKVEDGVLRFAASVGSPDKISDEYVPLVLKINRFGEVSMNRDTELDTVGNDVGEKPDTDDDGV